MNNFVAQLLPEISPPNNVVGCQKCELCGHKNKRLIWGEGNPLAQIFVILDNPGARENNLGEPMVCGTRKVLQKAVLNAGIDIQNIFVSYLLKCRPTKKYDKEKSRLICKNYLLEQIVDHQPRIVCCLGDVAVQSYFNNINVTVKGLRGSDYNINKIKTIVSYHPLAVLRRPTLYKYFVSDWILVRNSLQQ